MEAKTIARSAQLVATSIDELDGLSGHDVPRGTEKRAAETGRLKRPRAVSAAPGCALRVTDSGQGSTEDPLTFRTT